MALVMKNESFWSAARENKVDYISYFDRLTELSISMFDWKNLPETIDERFLELTLFYDGYILFFYDEILGYLTLQCTIGGDLDVYRIPVRRNAFSSNGYYRELDNQNSVIIFNNLLHTNAWLQVENFAKRLYEFDRVIDVNINAQKTPVLLSCEESQRLTIKNLYMKYEGNEPFIFGDKNLSPNSIKAISTEAPFVADKIYNLKTQYWNEILTYLGISNTNIQKKERLLTDEVLRNLGGTLASRRSRLQARKQACKQINKMFGLNIDCDFSEDFNMLMTISDELDGLDNTLEEGADNE